jgi:hypothetical protein
LSHAPILFALVIFKTRYYFLLVGLGLQSLFTLPTIAGMADMEHHAPFFLLGWCFKNFFGLAGLEPQFLKYLELQSNIIFHTSFTCFPFGKKFQLQC